MSESDIWKIANDTLYFFNQYRGLQIIDVTSPDKPVVRGTSELPAVAEQMYLLDNNYVVLLARDGCGWDANGPVSMAMSKVVGGVPSIAATLPIAGNIQESRSVGPLYVAAEVYRRVFFHQTRQRLRRDPRNAGSYRSPRLIWPIRHSRSPGKVSGPQVTAM